MPLMTTNVPVPGSDSNGGEVPPHLYLRERDALVARIAKGVILCFVVAAGFFAFVGLGNASGPSGFDGALFWGAITRAGLGPDRAIGAASALSAVIIALQLTTRTIARHERPEDAAATEARRSVLAVVSLTCAVAAAGWTIAVYAHGGIALTPSSTGIVLIPAAAGILMCVLALDGALGVDSHLERTAARLRAERRRERVEHLMRRFPDAPARRGRRAGRYAATGIVAIAIAVAPTILALVTAEAAGVPTRAFVTLGWIGVIMSIVFSAFAVYGVTAWRTDNKVEAVGTWILCVAMFAVYVLTGPATVGEATRSDPTTTAALLVSVVAYGTPPIAVALFVSRDGMFGGATLGTEAVRRALDRRSRLRPVASAEPATGAGVRHAALWLLALSVVLAPAAIFLLTRKHVRDTIGATQRGLYRAGWVIGLVFVLLEFGALPVAMIHAVRP
jgi:hypothetical protein